MRFDFGELRGVARPPQTEFSRLRRRFGYAFRAGGVGWLHNRAFALLHQRWPGWGAVHFHLQGGTKRCA